MRDVLDGDWDASAYWSTSNVGEAVPGVLTPLNWSLWKRGGEFGLRAALVAVGALERSLAEPPDSDEDRIMGLFHGRLAASVDFMGRMGDRLPATSGAAIAEQLLGRLPEDFVSEPTLARLPVVAVSMPRALTQSPRAVRVLHRETEPWWSDQVARTATLDLAGARAGWTAAAARFEHAMAIHVTCVFATVQPLYDVIQRVCGSVGRADLAQRLLAGLGNHAEVQVVEDLWAVSRDRLGLETFLARHGYHGHNEGEIASRVWREDPAPVRALVAQYQAKDESPDAVVARRAQERAEAERELLAAVPRLARPGVRFALEAAGRVVPLRGVGKVAFLQCVDVARACSRRAGELLAADGALDQPDDVYYLTGHELLGGGTPSSRADAPGGDDLRRVVAERRRRRAEHLGVVLPHGWRGRPDVTAATSDDGDRTGLTLNGIGASGGTVEARVRVVLDASMDDIEAGELLVAPYTDPSWGPIMFTSAGLIVDIGGELSHAAVVARELGVPCVMGTGDGTRRLRDGDLCRIDGDRGTVEVLEAA